MMNLGTTTQAARKAHHCDSCGGKIEVGQTYVRSRVVDGGDAWVWKSHEDCQRASVILFEEGIEGDDYTLVSVRDMDREDREIVWAKSPACRRWEAAP